MGIKATILLLQVTSLQNCKRDDLNMAKMAKKVEPEEINWISLTVAQKNAIRTNYVQFKINNTLERNCWYVVNHIKSQVQWAFWQLFVLPWTIFNI